MSTPRSDIVTPQEAPLPPEDIHLPARGFTIDRRKASLAAFACWAGWGTMVWLVLHDRTAAIDRAGLLWFRTGAQLAGRGGTHVGEAVRDVTALGGVLISTLATIAAVIALLFLRLRREAILFALTVILGWGLNNAMKGLIGRDRPELVPHLTQATGLSFPSGHSFASAMIYIGMALAFASMSQRHSVRYTLIASAMLLSGFIAWSRVLLGVHYPSDAIAGWLGGTAWAFTAAALLYRPARAAAESDTADHLDPTTG